MTRGGFTPTQHADQALLQRAQEDPSAAEAIYDAYTDALFGYLMKRCGHRETAEDILSQTFLKFMEALPSLEWQGYPLSAWLYRTASNALIDHWRKAGRELPSDEDDDGPPAPQNPAKDAHLAMEREKLIELIGTLSERDQQVLDLRFFAGLEAHEIASELKIPSNNASVMIYRALGRLRNAYQTSYGTISPNE